MSELLAPAPDQVKVMEPDELLKQYDRLIKKIANRYTSTAAHYAWIDADDLQQVASIALLKAQETYNPDKGAFINHACMIMQGEIMKALNIRWTPYGNQYEPDTVSLDEPITEESDTTRGETIPGSDEPLEDRAVRADIAERVRAAVHALPDDQEEVIERLYLNSPTETKQQIALDKGVTGQSIANRQRVALRKLRYKLWYMRPEMPNHIGLESFNTQWMSEPEQYVIDRENRKGQAYDRLLEEYNKIIYGEDETE